MKNLSVLVGAIAILSFTSSGQNGKKVPAPVINSFAQKFPGASKVKWDKESPAEWEAEFILSGVEYSGNFGESGTWVETEYKTGSAGLPSAVKATLDEEFEDFAIGLAEVSETKESRVFELVLKNGREKMEISMEKDGKIVNKSRAEEEDE